MAEILEVLQIKEFPKMEQMDTLDLRPELAEEHMGPSMMLTDMTHLLPDWDMHRNGPTGFTTVSRRDLAIAKEFISSVRDLQNNVEKKASKVWSEIGKTENDFRRVFLEHNKLIKENLDKVIRSDKKIADEISAQAAIRADIDTAREELAFLRNCVSLYKRNIKEYRIYEQFLEQLVLKSPKYVSAEDVFNSYVGMANMRDVIAYKATEAQGDVMKINYRLLKLTEDLRTQILEIGQQRQKLDSDYERASQVTKYWDRLILKCKLLIMDKQKERSIIHQMFYDLYTMSCLNQGIPATVAKDNLEEQLDVIKQYVNVRKRILKRAKYLQQKRVTIQEKKKKIK